MPKEMPKERYKLILRQLIYHTWYDSSFIIIITNHMYFTTLTYFSWNKISLWRTGNEPISKWQ